MLRAAYRSSSTTATTSSSGPITGRNSGIRSIGETNPHERHEQRDLRPAGDVGVGAQPT